MQSELANPIVMCNELLKRDFDNGTTDLSETKKA